MTEKGKRGQSKEKDKKDFVLGRLWVEETQSNLRLQRLCTTFKPVGAGSML